MKVNNAVSAACLAATAAMAQVLPQRVAYAPGMMVPPAGMVTEPSGVIASLITRLHSYFDFSHISGASTDTPVIIQKVFDPATSKFTHLSMDVVRSGDAYYIPVCTTDSIAAAGSSTTPPTESCQYGIQLTPVPQNAARTLLRMVHTMMRLISGGAHLPAFTFTGMSARMPEAVHPST